MSTIINQVNIESVTVSLGDDGKYKVALSWAVSVSGAASYSGDYGICLIDETGEIETQTAAGASTSATVIFEKLTDDKDYHVKVRAPEETGGVESGIERIITDHYENISGTYDGKTLSLVWDVQSFSAHEAICTLESNNKYSRVFKEYPGAERAVIDNVTVKLGRTFTAAVRSVSGCSAGPESDTLTFYSAPPFITDAEVTDGSSGTDIAVKFTSEHDDIETVSLVLGMNGKKMYESKPAKAAKAESVYSVTVNVGASELTRSEIEKCTVSCAYVNGSAKTMLCGDGSEMPLARPSVSAVDIQGGKAVMRISYPESVAALGFELSDASIVSGDTYTVALTAQTPAIRPRYDRNGTVRRGVSSEPAQGFIPGYYVSGGGLIYRDTDFSQTAVTHTWSVELFKTPPPGGQIKSGALSLSYDGSEYTLTVNISEEGQILNLNIKDYNEFIDQIKDIITPYGFFALTDAILRIAPQAFADTPYLLCAHSPSDRFTDIRPGLRLTANTAVYMPQYVENSEDAQGFVSTNNAGWSFALSGDGSFLEPDLYIGQMAKYLNDSSLNDTTKVTYASGVADFMRPSLHQPYYRVLFPLTLEPSMVTEDPYLADNTVIMTSESYGEILNASAAIKESAANIYKLTIPLMIFRGRSALSLSVPVQINGILCYVPVGCSVKQALDMYGYGALVNIQRKDDTGILRPVFAAKIEDLDNLMLITGDRLEV